MRMLAKIHVSFYSHAKNLLFFLSKKSKEEILRSKVFRMTKNF
jgi:hypothetical protein